MREPTSRPDSIKAPPTPEPRCSALTILLDPHNRSVGVERLMLLDEQITATLVIELGCRASTSRARVGAIEDRDECLQIDLIRRRQVPSQPVDLFAIVAASRPGCPCRS